MIDDVVISALKDKHDSAPRRTKVPWAKFVEAFRKIRRTACLVSNCKHNMCVHKNGAAWSPAIYPPGIPRQKQFVEGVSLLVVDLDHLSNKQLDDALAPLAPYQRILHASHSDRPADSGTCTCGSEPGALHGQDCPSRVDRCVRAIVPLSRAVTRDEWPRFWPTAMAFLQQPADPSTCDANRLYFLPSRPKDADNYFFETHDGTALDVEAILVIAPPDAPSVADSLHVDPNGVVDPGQRHAMLKSLAGAMRFRGSGYSEIETALLAANKARCNPPKSDAEVKKIAQWAADQPMTTLPRGGGDGGGGGDAGSDEADFLRDKAGHPFNNQWNIEVAIRKLGVRLRYDEFSGDEIVEGLAGYGPRFDDTALVNLRLKIDSTWRFLPGRELFCDVTSNIARRNGFHPVRDYLSSIAWDQEPRIERWLIDYAGAPDTPYVRAVSRIVLVAACRRIRQPGAKYDEMLILETPLQGTEKSSALRILAFNDDWFTDDLPLGSDTRRFMESTGGKWIVEAGELKGMGRGDVAALKACLSRQRDEARMAYGRKNARVARQFVIIGTTNETEGYLRDATGNRRFWPVRIQRFDLGRLRSDRDQLWAEAAEAEALGESIRLDPMLYEAASLEQEARLTGDDPIIDVLHRALGARTGKLRVSDAYLICGIEPGKANQDQITRFGRAIRELGWERQRRRFDGTLQYAYVKGTSTEREVELIVEYDAHMRSVRIEIDKSAQTTTTN